jgi:hypothetical protein
MERHDNLEETERKKWQKCCPVSIAASAGAAGPGNTTAPDLIGEKIIRPMTIQMISRPQV